MENRNNGFSHRMKRMLRTDDERGKTAYRIQVTVGSVALAMSVFALLMQLLK